MDKIDAFWRCFVLSPALIWAEAWLVPLAVTL